MVQIDDFSVPNYRLIMDKAIQSAVAVLAHSIATNFLKLRSNMIQVRMFDMIMKSREKVLSKDSNLNILSILNNPDLSSIYYRYALAC